MSMPRRVSRRMYAVSLKSVGIIAGTMSYSRRAAIAHFLGDGLTRGEWENSKRAGYRTVKCGVVVLIKEDGKC